MRYQGGKVLIAKEISEKILETMTRKNIDSSTLVSLFCGACAVETKLADHFEKVICNDKSKYLIALLKAVQNGWEIPEYISAEQYKYIRENKDEDKALTGFVGFGCSFGGKWFGGYAATTKKRNYVREAANSLTRDKKHWHNIEFVCKDYKDVLLPNNCVIYADPPYKGTTPYPSVSKFDSEEFWDYMRELSNNYLVFISERMAPEDFISIWEKQKRVTISKANNTTPAIEKLFIHESNI